MATAKKPPVARKPAAKKPATPVATPVPPEATVTADQPLQVSPGSGVDTSTLAGVEAASRGVQTMNAQAKDLDAKVRDLLLEQDPMWAVFFDRHSEIYRAILDQYVRDNGYLDPNKLEATILATNEWRSTADAARKDMLLQEQDPTTWSKQRSDLAWSLGRTALQLGLTLSEQQLAAIADQAYRNGWQNDQSRLQSLLFVTGSPSGGGRIAGNAASVRQKLTRYGLPVNDAQVADWARQITEGTLDPDAVDEMIRNQAKARFPHLANSIDQGLTPEDYYAPYKSVLANELEMNPNDINFFTDSQWSSVIDGGATGRPMTLTEAARYARSLPQWKTTDKANRVAASMEMKILQNFGKVA